MRDVEQLKGYQGYHKSEYHVSIGDVIRVIIRMNINIHERCQLHSLEGLLEECK